MDDPRKVLTRSVEVLKRDVRRQRYRFANWSRLSWQVGKQGLCSTGQDSTRQKAFNRKVHEENPRRTQRESCLKTSASSACSALELLFPPPFAEIFAHADGVVSSPWPVISQICRAKISVSGAEPVEQEMLGHAKFKSFSDINAHAP